MKKNLSYPLIILLFYWLALNYLVIASPVSFFPAPDGVSSTNQVQYQYNKALEPPSTGVWQEIELPDDWHGNHQDQTDIWYRAHIDLEKDHVPVWGVYLPAVTHNAAVFVNGVWVGQGGSFDQPVSRHHNEPLYFEFSNDLVKNGLNEIDVHVKTEFYGQGLLDAFYVAPSDQLQSAYHWKKFWRVTFITWVTAAMFVMAAIVLVFYIVRPQDVVYGIFCLELMFWSVHNLNLFVADIPMSTRLWEAIIMGTLGWTVIAMIFFNHRFVGYRVVWVEKACLAIGILGVLFLFLPSIEAILTVGYKIWDSFLVVIGSYAIFHLVYVYRKKRSADVYLMLLVGMPMLVFGFHDILVVNHLHDKREGLIIQYSTIPAAILFGWFLLKRFIGAVNEAEQLNLTLEQRIKQREQELKIQFEKVKGLEKERVLLGERERIMRDMHDGIGGQLVSLATMLQGQSGEVFKTVQKKIEESITDLRFVIDSLDPSINDLSTLLGMLRYRLSDQLDSAPINFKWSVTDLPTSTCVTTNSSIHILRIIQEAITNALKHSKATELEVKTDVVEIDRQQYIQIDVQDNGVGIDENKTQGNGLKNIQYRAEKIGASVELETNQQGTLVRLLLVI
ncbi:MAG: ATP-binding protein [Gammaproteobacteria bacterium]|nr:ATP-binding protein [Gammaproteobacteria bacterium]